MEIPQGLVDAIHAGDCVAFVGAGFSSPDVPGWIELLKGVAAAPQLEATTKEQVEALFEEGETEAAAQVLRDALGQRDFAAALDGLIPADPSDRIQQRLNWLHGIPFRSVLTTNFDRFLDGPEPGRDAYLQVLRPKGHRWWESRFWDGSSPKHEAVALHGSIEVPDSIVFTRRDYRRQLYQTPGYLTFVRSVMATTTVLYIGFSFSDGYLEELRSEVLALLEHRGTDEPIAYALVTASEAEVEYARSHEGIQILPYTGANDYAEFDEYLETIHLRTNPALRLGQLLDGKRLLWIDPDEESIEHGVNYLERAIGEGASLGSSSAPAPNTFDRGCGSPPRPPASL